MPTAGIPSLACKPPRRRASHFAVVDDGVDGLTAAILAMATADGTEAVRGRYDASGPAPAITPDAHDAAATLAQRFAAGQPGAFEEVVAEYQTRVERLAHRLLGWRSMDVEDAVQDVFLAALTNASRVRGERGLWAWLATITVNTCRSRMRRAWVLEKVLGRRTPSATESPPADASAEQREDFTQVRAAIERLAARDREVIVLHYLEEMRLPDVANVLGVSPNAVHVRLHRARQRLQRELEPDGKPD